MPGRLRNHLPGASPGRDPAGDVCLSAEKKKKNYLRSHLAKEETIVRISRTGCYFRRQRCQRPTRKVIVQHILENHNKENNWRYSWLSIDSSDAGNNNDDNS